MAIKISNLSNLVVQSGNAGIPAAETLKNTSQNQAASELVQSTLSGAGQQTASNQRVGPDSFPSAEAGARLGEESRRVMNPTLNQSQISSGTGAVRGTSPRTRPSESPRSSGFAGTSAGSAAASAGLTIRDTVQPSGQTDDSVLMPDRTVGSVSSAIQSLSTTISTGLTLNNGNDLISDIPPIENEIPTELFEFNKSIYDSEISQIGVISANPEIIGFLPLTNLYKNADEQSNIGVIYDLQNSLRDSTIKRAQEIVDSYFSANPAQKSVLQSIRQQNMSKYSVVSSSIPKIIRLKMSTIAVTKIAGAASNVQLKVDGFIATTDAEKRSASGLFTQISLDPTITSPTILTGTDTTASESIEGIRSVEYVDSDVTKYDSGTSIVEKLKSKFIGTSNSSILSLTPESQLNTTLQYQLMKASIAQIFEGRNFSQSSVGGYYESPYQSLTYQKIAPISSLISENITMKPGFPFAKVTIQEIAYFMQNSYDISTSLDTNEFVENLKNSSIYFAGNIISDGTSIRPAYNSESPDYESETYMIGYDRSRYNLPIVGIDSSVKNDQFFDQIIPMLASQVADLKIGSFFDALPDSLNFRSSNSPSVVDTLSDPLRYAVQTNTGRNIFIFDETLPTTEGAQSDPISSIVFRTPDELSSIQAQLSDVNTNFSSFLRDRKFYFSNQCALTIMKTFYEKFSNVLGSSFLNKNSAEISAGDFNPACFAMFFTAIEDTFASAKLHKIMSDTFSIPRALYDGRASSISLLEFGLQFSLARTLDINYPETENSFDFGSFSLSGVGQKNRIQYEIEGSSGQEVAQKLFSTGTGIFNMFKEILDSLSGFGDSDTNILSQIEYSAYIFFLRILENIKISGTYTSTVSKRDTVPDFGFSVDISWNPVDIAILVDCLNSAFNATSAKDVVYTNFSNIVGSNPSEEQKSKIDELFQKIRSPIRSTLQVYQDFRSLAGYQKTIIESQLTNIASINSLQTKVIEAYGGDERASQILGRYLTFESAVESLYKTARYLNFIPGTRISTVATRSNHYRSIVKSAFKEIIPNKEDMKICIVGMPYGNIESLRLALQSMDLFFDVKISADSATRFFETDTKSNYAFPYDIASRSSNPRAAGPYGSEFPGLYDDFDLSSTVDSIEDNSISIYKISESGSTLDILQRSEVGNDEKNIDFPVAIVQAALQAYVEDIYGLYPRYSSTKVSLRQDPYPEETYADAALAYSSIPRETDDERLIYSRLKSVIMMHEDFMSTRTLEEFEASPVFDKIVYLLVDGSLITDIISQFYAKVSVDPKQVSSFGNAEMLEYLEEQQQQGRDLRNAFEDAITRSSPYFSGVDIKTLVLDASKNVQNLQTLVGPITELQVKDLANGNVDVFANATDFYGGKYGYTQVNYLNLSNVARDAYSNSANTSQVRNLSNQSTITSTQNVLTSATTTNAANLVDVSIASNVSRAASTSTNLIRNINTRRR